jgi:hypothetical protein
LGDILQFFFDASAPWTMDSVFQPGNDPVPHQLSAISLCEVKYQIGRIFEGFIWISDLIRTHQTQEVRQTIFIPENLMVRPIVVLLLRSLHFF